MPDEKKRALIFGGTGQMGSYLYEHLRGLGYYNIVSFGSRGCPFSEPIWDLRQRLTRVIGDTKPSEIYNFAGKMNAQGSWRHPFEYTFVNGVAVQILLEVIFETCPKTKFFNAGSADMFDKGSVNQYEDTLQQADNPHALSKMFACEAVRLYRDQKGLFASTGIFFNAESPKRSKEFFAEKVAGEVVRVKREFEATGNFQKIKLGDLRARRDWGWAPEFVQVAQKMLQMEEPCDLVIGTGETHTCLDFVEEALRAADLPDVDKNFNLYVSYERSPDLYKARDTMSARPRMAKALLGWEAQYKFKDVVRMLVEAELLKTKELKTEGQLA